MRTTTEVPTGVLVDTNILVRLLLLKSEESVKAEQAVDALLHKRTSLFFTLQNVSELWNVATRPVSERGGLGIAPDNVARALVLLQATMSFLPDTFEVFQIWKDLVHTHQIRGVRVHDAKLAASVFAYKLDAILTLNTRDFNRFTGITVYHPEQVIARA